MTKTMNEQTNDTLQDQILKILFAEGLGEGLANIAQILMNAAMLIIQFVWEIVCLYRNARAARSWLQCRSGDHRSPLFHFFIHAATTDRRHNSNQSRLGKPVRLFSGGEEKRLQDAREQARSSAIHWTDLWGQRSLPMKMSLRLPLLLFCLPSPSLPSS